MGDKNNWHLDEIQAHDDDNLRTLINSAKDHYFEYVTEITEFSGLCLNAALNKHGIDLAVAEQMSKDKESYSDVGAAIDKLLNEKHVRVEPRMHYEGLDRWKCGIYIYKDNEIADWISAPIHLDNIIESKYRYTLRTTVVL
jgi:hypothetical protein